MYGAFYDQLAAQRRQPPSPSASRPRPAAAVQRRSVLGELNLTERDRSLLQLQQRKREAERERQFRVCGSDVGYAERRFQRGLLAEAERENWEYQQQQQQQQMQQMQQHQQMQQVQQQSQTPTGRYHAVHVDTARAPPPPFSQRGGYSRRLRSFSDDDKNIVKRCVRCIVESSYINNAGDFRTRTGFHRGDARRLYDGLCRDESDWSRYDGGSNVWFLINNCINEILHNNVCQEWSRWFGSVSRRRVEELYDRLDGPGKVLQRYNGRIVELPTPRHHLAPAAQGFAEAPR